MTLESLHQTLGSIWTLWALALFAGIVLWACWPANRSRFDRDSRIPLEDDR